MLNWTPPSDNARAGFAVLVGIVGAMAIGSGGAYLVILAYQSVERWAR